MTDTEDMAGAEALYREGDRLHDEGDFAGAIERLQAALRLAPAHWLARYTLAGGLAGYRPPRRGRGALRGTASPRRRRTRRRRVPGTTSGSPAITSGAPSAPRRPTGRRWR